MVPQFNNPITPKGALVQQIAKRRLGSVQAAPVAPTPTAGIFPSNDTTMQATLQRIAGLRNTLGIQ